MKRHYDPTFGYGLGFQTAEFLSKVVSKQVRQSATPLQIMRRKTLRQAPCQYTLSPVCHLGAITILAGAAGRLCRCDARRCSPPGKRDRPDMLVPLCCRREITATRAASAGPAALSLSGSREQVNEARQQFAAAKRVDALDHENK